MHYIICCNQLLSTMSHDNNQFIPIELQNKHPLNKVPSQMKRYDIYEWSGGVIQKSIKIEINTTYPIDDNIKLGHMCNN